MLTPNALYLTADLRRIEHDALALLPQGTLMQRAARAVAGLALELLGSRAAGARVLALAGPGNNGGDTLLAAVLLKQAGAAVTAMHCADQARMSPDAQRALDAARDAAIEFGTPDPGTLRDGAWDLVLDGLFGIGLARGPDVALRALIAAINRLPCPVLAIDVPSGLGADTGMPFDGDDSAVIATHTVTFIADKPGLHTGRGRDHAGRVVVDTLDIPAALYPASALHLSGVPMFSHALRRRSHYSHKGSFGDVTLLGGAPGMAGALVLASRAALFTGAGRVYAGFVDQPPAYDSKHPEVMCRQASVIELSAGALVAGPGLGMSDAALQVLRSALTSPLPAVLDADALNLLAANPGLRTLLANRQAPSLLTPHPLEAARLLGCATADIQADRVGAARRLAAQCRAVVLLKGSGTIIADAGGEAAVNPTGNPALATGGTGDVLAGICGTLLAHGCSAWHAALAGAWMHGAAADELVENGTGPVGLSAGELVPAIRAVLNRLVGQRAVRAGGQQQS